jgi:hypothetical protein
MNKLGAQTRYCGNNVYTVHVHVIFYYNLRVPEERQFNSIHFNL